MSLYELAILGAATAQDRKILTATIGDMVEDFGLMPGNDIAIRDAATLAARDKGAAFAAVYFGAANHLDVDAAQEVVRSSAPVIPIISADGDFGTQIPAVLQSFNGLRRRGDDPNMTALAAALLECVGLLRRQRRVFVSYRRSEARATALQMHDLLTARGFDVFLDTHDIRPGDPFQDVLWHRLIDSDVMVMLDTPSYFDSRWTLQEFGRARSKDIQILRVVWPGHTPNKATDLAETVYLDHGQLGGSDGPLIEDSANALVLAVERLRSRSIAARYMSITGKLRADIAKIGAEIVGVGAHRAIAVRLLNDHKIWAYPIVGVPTAEILNDVANKAMDAEQRTVPILVYDHSGIRDAWNAHLRWLDENIRAVRMIKASEAGWALAAWEA